MGKFLTFFKIINLYNDMNITEYDKQNRINSKDFNTSILKYAQDNNVDILNIKVKD